MNIDKLSLKRIDTLHPRIRFQAKNVLLESYAADVPIRITQAFRTFAEQDKLYEQGRSLPGEIVTNAKAGQSWHNYGLAFDFVLLKPNEKEISWDMKADYDRDGEKDWAEVVSIAKRNFFEWGGDWDKPDYPHFQNRFGLTIDGAFKLYKSNKVDNAGFIKV